METGFSHLNKRMEMKSEEMIMSGRKWEAKTQLFRDERKERRGLMPNAKSSFSPFFDILYSFTFPLCLC